MRGRIPPPHSYFLWRVMEMEVGENKRFEITRLHLAIPKPLLYELRKYGLMDDIDNVVSELLYEKVEDLKWREKNDGKFDR